MSPAEAAIKPCPFCGAGETQITENGKVWLGTRYSEPSSVSVRHWCAPVDGQPNRMIERVGRDEASAIAAWNMRSELDALRARCEAAETVLRESREFWCSYSMMNECAQDDICDEKDAMLKRMDIDAHLKGAGRE